MPQFDLVINADGTHGNNGINGTNYASGSPSEYRSGGRHGGNAGDPTPGEDALTLHIKLSRIREKENVPADFDPAGDIVVSVDKHRQSCQRDSPHSQDTNNFFHSLGRTGNVIISARGGDGGKGGHGGHGRRGTRGQAGRNATRWSSGSSGEPGGDGGDAGDGTSGADAGNGGDVSILVPEEDMDLLLALKQPLVDGGRGGLPGKNGKPGSGGPGGAGGKSYKWMEPHYLYNDKGEQTVYYTYQRNPGGRARSSGRPGRRSNVSLLAGRNGSRGSVKIFVNRSGRETPDGPYPSPYRFEVIGFNIVDGNDDGVLEFGDEVSLENILVRNSGGMPSPSMSLVTVHARSTNWLISQNVQLALPNSVEPGYTARLDKALKFRVKTPRQCRIGQPFSLTDTVRVGGYIDGIERALPKFHCGQSVLLQYPLQMSNLRYLRCLNHGEQTPITWMVENISTKSLGIQSPSRRQISFLLSEDLDHNQENPQSDKSQRDNTTEIPLYSLEGQENTPLQDIVTITEAASTYTIKEFTLSLCLTPPNGGTPVPIQKYIIPIQISSPFRYNPKAEVLLITNFCTTTKEVDEWRQCCNNLGIVMDIWNISHNGHFELLGPPISGKTKLFDLYKGKAIVILGNEFPYFASGHRMGTDLIDHNDFANAADQGTNIFVAGTDLKDPGLQNLMRFLRSTSYPNSKTFSKAKQLLQAVSTDYAKPDFRDTKFIWTTFRNNSERCFKKARRIATELRRRLPNIRFMVSWAANDGTSQGPSGEITVLPCINYDSSKFIVTNSVLNNSMESKIFGILLSLPFSKRLEMLWDRWSDSNQFNSPITHPISQSIYYEIIIQLTRLVDPNPPWPDCFAQEDLFNQLPRLSAFFAFNPGQKFCHETVVRVTEFLAVLCYWVNCCPSCLPTALSFGSRRKRLRSELDKRISRFILDHYGTKSVKEQFDDLVRELNREMRKPHLTATQRKEEVLQLLFDNVGISNAITFGSGRVVDFEVAGNMFRTQPEILKWEELDNSDQLARDLEHAKTELRELGRLSEDDWFEQ